MIPQRRLQLAAGRTEVQWMTTALKVAFATSDMRHVDQHFGAAQAFALYAVTPQQARFIAAVAFSELTMDGNEAKLSAKIDALHECIAVYSQAVGASAIGQLRAAGIQPVKVASGSDIRELIAALQLALRQGPVGWLAKAIVGPMPANPARFDEMEAQGWEE